ncbi:hypothetical protein A3F29_01990 [Candidatus Roizmanbacteria bacterium RIFCSPHIGHO2_12_FULL_33_9]|uniref:Uncharacterized protein n=1 Tax=Candidatus Roizmanbacteria bacterium RIFCSPHIGHO2_12_FULL_33_9 TaxID=1802045 RepID=A0A1F7HIT5_9BACT|nr:MAG: hypothetical protein A3F29_01990 [Candidatus Roizmanbacteria bacterium RIFCSPHIGHO2_12_FULL_33_9]
MERRGLQNRGEKVTSRAKEIAIGAAETAGGLFISWVAYKYATELKEPGVTGLLAMTVPAFIFNGVKHFINAHRLNPNNLIPPQSSNNVIHPNTHMEWEI